MSVLITCTVRTIMCSMSTSNSLSSSTGTRNRRCSAGSSGSVIRYVGSVCFSLGMGRGGRGGSTESVLYADSPQSDVVSQLRGLRC